MNPFLILLVLVVAGTGLITYRRTKDMKKAIIAAVIAIVVIYGLALIADQFME